MSTEMKRASDRAAARRKAAIARGGNPLLVTGDRAAGARPRVLARLPALTGPCRGEGQLFFSEDPAEQSLAQRICRGCPVRAQCLSGALEREEPWGVWGGVLLDGGKIVIAEVAS